MKKIFLLIALCCASVTVSRAQEFVIINPDARTSAMGDVSAAVTGDAWSIYGNAAAPLFNNKKVQVQVSYTPWMSAVEKGHALYSLGGYFNFGKRHTLSIGGRMYNEPKLVGNEDYPFVPKDEYNEPLTIAVTRPNSKSLDLAYGIRFSDKVGMAINAGYIHNSNGVGTKTSVVSLGLSLYSSLPVSITDGSKLNIGVTASNYGFSFGSGKASLPLSGKVGASLYIPMTEMHSIEAALDLGYLYQSKSMNSFLANVGLEYSLMNCFMVRAGYAYGNYGCVTAGLGVRFAHVQLDASYWFGAASCPWKNTFRVGLGVEF